MTDKELQKLKRPEILEIMLNLQNELDKEKEENEALRARLGEKNIAIEKSGSIAEAALEINGVFDAAQKAADVYLDNVKKMHTEQKTYHEQIMAKTTAEAEGILTQAKREAETLKTKTDIECRKKIKNAEEECALKIRTTEEECARKISETNNLCTKKIKETQDKCTAISSLDNQIASFFGNNASAQQVVQSMTQENETTEA